MKRTHRLSIEIEHRKLTISLTRASGADVRAGSESSVDAIEPFSFPPACPDCGAPWITVMAHVGEFAASGDNAIYRALQRHGLHLHVAPTGQLNICSKSLEEFRSEETKESL